MKNVSRNIKKILFLFSLLIYIGFCFYLSTDTTSQSKFLSYQEAMEEVNLKPFTFFISRTNKKLSDDNFLLSLKNQTVYADTLIYAITYENDRRYLKACIPNQFGKRILLKLQLEDNQKFTEASLRFTRAVIEAEIKDVNLLPVFSEIETFDKSPLLTSISYDVLLEGTLIDLLYSAKI